jgi:hypothetical protein
MTGWVVVGSQDWWKGGRLGVCADIFGVCGGNRLLAVFTRI